MVSFDSGEYKCTFDENIISVTKGEDLWNGSNDKEHYDFLKRFSENQSDETIFISIYRCFI